MHAKVRSTSRLHRVRPSISVSPLGLRRKADENGSLRVVSNPDDCTIRFRGTTTEKRGGDVTIDAIPPGRYPLTVAHESKTLRTDVDVQKGMEPSRRISRRA
jgi:hypothetical protein